MSKTAHFIAGHPLRIGGALGMHKAKEKDRKDGERVFVFKVDENEYYVSNNIKDGENGTQEEDSYRGLFGAGYDFTIHQEKWDKIQKDFLEKRVKVLTDLKIDEKEARSFIGKAACGYYAGQEIAGYRSDTDQMYKEFNKLFGSDENQKNKALDSFQKLQDHIDIPGIENLRFVHLYSHVANPVQAGLSLDKKIDLEKHFTGLFYKKDIEQGDFVDAVKKTIKTAIEKLKEDGFKAINTTTPGDGVFKNPVWPDLRRDIWSDINIKTEGLNKKIQRRAKGNTAKEIVKEFVDQQKQEAAEEEKILAAEAEEAARKAEEERLAAEAAEAARKAEEERLAAEAARKAEAVRKAPEAPEAPEAAEAARKEAGREATEEIRNQFYLTEEEKSTSEKFLEWNSNAFTKLKRINIEQNIYQECRELFLNPQDKEGNKVFIGWGGRLQQDNDLNSNIFTITQVIEGGFAAAIGLKAGDKIGIDVSHDDFKSKADENPKDLEVILINKLRNGELDGINKIGEYNLSNENHKEILNSYNNNYARVFIKENGSYKLNKDQTEVKKSPNFKELNLTKKQAILKHTSSTEDQKEKDIDFILRQDLSDFSSNKKDEIFGIINIYYELLDSKGKMLFKHENKIADDGSLASHISYADRIRDGKEWATEPVIASLAEDLGVQINIHQSVKEVLQYNEYEGRPQCNIYFSPGHYRSCDKDGKNIKEVMNKVGDCAFESILYQLSLITDHNFKQSLNEKGINFDGANYEGMNKTSCTNHGQNIQNIREIAAEAYKNKMQQIFAPSTSPSNPKVLPKDPYKTMG